MGRRNEIQPTENSTGRGSSFRPGSALPVLIVFVASFIIHTVLNLLTKSAPTVVIDEGLYTNIARSLAWKGELAFRGQPVNYPYLLYPVLLVPIYRLNRLLGGDIFRYIQVFNTLLITSSVFPAALFAHDFTKDRKKAFFTACITALMPDMLMGGFTMTESLIWPLSLWMVCFAYRFLREKNLKYGLLTALFTGLLFAAKPGAIAAGAVILAVYLFHALKDRGPFLQNILLSFALILMIIGTVYGIYLALFRQSSSLLGLYTKQTSEWTSKTVFVALEAFFLMIFLWIFACGGLYGILPFVCFSNYEEEKRKFITAFGAGLIVSVLGTSVFVVPFDWDDSLGVLPLHLRYTAMYIPVMFVFSQEIEAVPEKLKKRFFAAMIVFMLLSLFPGARSGFVKGGTTEFDSMALSAFTTTLNLDGDISGWILTVIVLIFSAVVLFFVSRNVFSKRLRDICPVFFAFFLLYNAVCAHINVYIYIDPTIAADAKEINELAGTSECLGITQRAYEDIYSYWLDGRLNGPMQQVTVDQMFVTMRETGGIYFPFVPLDQLPNVNDHETPDTDKFVLGKTIPEHIELNDSVSVHRTANGHFAFVKITPGVRWVDSMVWGLNDNDLYEGESCFIQIFDETGIPDEKMQIKLTASGNGTLNVEGNRIKLTGFAQTFEITLPKNDLIEIKSESGSAQIYAYSTRN